ncbi:UNVERIFIED_CONTAM: 2-hydroxyisoflavanone dehydratase [Sesamum radiatum]|uniref:2-hydroxyisoflavanone dehydratase n=1 Tax=Sesamum radiatum TaxID=300843 RepID=A0AAW2QIQ9_SESRA
MNLLSAESGSLVVSVEYRLAPEHPLPAAYEDSWDALKWVCSHVLDQTHFEKDEWITNHTDFNRVFIGGDSAGGNIAHNVSLRAGSESLPGNVRILGAILSHPYFWGSNPLGHEPKGDIEQSLAYTLWLFVYPSAPGGIDNPLINPLADGAPRLSGLGCSKIIVCLAEKDPLTARGLVYAEEVKKSGWKGEVEVMEIEGEGHCFHLYNPKTDKAKNLIKRLASFISH